MARKKRPLTTTEPLASATDEVDAGATATATSPARLIGLKILVFGAGAVLMGLEIAGSRVLAPHFGNSVFIWGSLIAIFLLAISVGNYLGGRFADQHPSHLVLNAISIGVSLWIFGLALFAEAFCSLIETQFDEQTGPLVASLALFLAPSIGMGMVSPFAIRLAASSVETVGKISGALYALSNVGSIVGTMITTFVLIPFVGLSAILKGLGAVLLVVAIVTSPGLWDRKQVSNLLWMAMVFGSLGLLLLVTPGAAPAPLPPGERIVVEVSTPYHNIAVVDNDRYGYRAMKFDRRYNESIISLEPPHVSFAEYTDYFHLALLLNPDPERALFIGAGGAVGPRAFHLHDPEMLIDVVDIDPKVLELTKSQFYLPEHPNIRTIASDGRIFVREAEPYDILVLDAFTIGGRIPFHLVTQEFFELCRARLTDDGVFVMNINSALEGPSAGIFRSTYKTLLQVFPQVYIFQKPSDRGEHVRHESTNIVFVASMSSERLALDEWRRRASEHRSASYIGARTLQRLTGDLVQDVPDVADAPLFTDDYAPIETMPF